MNIQEYDNFIKQNLINLLAYNNPKSEQPFDFDDLRHCIMLQLIKYAYDQYLPKNSIRSYLQPNMGLTNNTDAERALYSRLMQYAQYYRDVRNNELEEAFKMRSPELEAPDMSKRENKISGYKINEMQFFELGVMGRVPLLKCIANHRITNTKKISNAEFQGMMQEYDQLVGDLLQKLKGSDEDVLFSTIALFTLEWKYNVELFYACAVEAEKKHEKDVPVNSIAMLCVAVPVDSGKLVMESHFVLNRLKIVPYVYKENSVEWKRIMEKYEAYLGALNIFTKLRPEGGGPSIEEVFSKSFQIGEAAEYIKKNYDIRKIYQKKEWNSFRIKYVRRLYDICYKDIQPPKIK